MHDAATSRWNVAYDAADPLPMSDDATKLPFLDQSHPISQAGVVPVHTAAGTVALVYAIDSYTNHPSYRAALLQVSDGAVTGLYAAQPQGLQRPVVTGAAGDQRVSMTADLLAPDLGACCPVRTYTFELKVGADGATTEASDDRPLLGIWVTPVVDPAGSTNNAPLTVLSIDPGSPAAGKLSAGDVIKGFSGPRKVPASASTSTIGQLYAQMAGDQVGLRVATANATSKAVPVKAGPMSEVTAAATSPGLGYLGLQLTSDMTIESVTTNSPAAAAGLETGSTVTSVNGRAIHTTNDLPVALWATIGHPLPMVVTGADGLARTVTVTPTQQPSELTLTAHHI
ncbi:MAG: PDZ domain-containing protein [Terracoccus sp.]